ncbi:MAG: phosphoribosyl-ATP pyrophosphohydrolase [Bacteroidetes bacterium]|nr:MAG: phosphoribosyl-ATP pyrophosphohydrolase [Bacteroidota bacterium]
MNGIDFKKGNGLVPAVIQDYESKQVLMLGYMNEESYKATQSSGYVTFFSRSKNRLWVKGETSGNFLQVKSMDVDCDNDTLLIMAVPSGPVCHTGSFSCFEGSSVPKKLFFQELEDVISLRATASAESSYTRRLLDEGLDRVIQKVGEESVELVIAAKNEDDTAFVGEAADLIFHLLVLLHKKNVTLQQISQVLEQRHEKK